MIAELERRRRAWQAKLQRRRDKIRRALANGVDGAAVLEMIPDYLSMMSSDLRLPRLLDVLDDAPPDVFWKVMEAEWAVCDDTWSYTERLLHMMRRYQARAPALTRSGQDTELAVFRGCSLSGVRGISGLWIGRSPSDLRVGTEAFRCRIP